MNEPAEIDQLLRGQSGVINRAQVLRSGANDDDIERRIRRREWARVHRGVYVDHTGPLTWDQRCWAAVLVHWPAALSGRSALRSYRFPGIEEPAVIDVVVAADRHVRHAHRVRAHRSSRFDEEALRHLCPPRIRVEDAVIDLAADAPRPDQAVALIADAVGQRRTTASRLLACIAARRRLRHRSLLHEILGDVLEGCHSALERRYHRAVERAHGLPVGRRQRRVEVENRQIAYRDVEYEEHGVIVELDGRLGHELSGDRWADLQRDLDSTLSGAITLRLGWQQVLSPCRVAASIGQILARRGWAGVPSACGPDCTLGSQDGDLPASDAEKAPRTFDEPAA